jgi:hypothetical protein
MTATQLKRVGIYFRKSKNSCVHTSKDRAPYIVESRTRCDAPPRPPRARARAPPARRGSRVSSTSFLGEWRQSP